MLDGRIDTQGTVDELRTQDVLDVIAHEAAVEVKKDKGAVAAATPEAFGKEIEAKKPRKLVEDEHRGATLINLFSFLFTQTSQKSDASNGLFTEPTFRPQATIYGRSWHSLLLHSNFELSARRSGLKSGLKHMLRHSMDWTD